MAMEKIYSRVNWQNEPSEATALNDVNLNKMDSAINTLDDRILTLSTEDDSLDYRLDLVEDGKVDKVTGQGLSKTNDVQVTSATNVGTKIATVQIFPSTGGVSGVQIKNGVVVDSALSSSSENPVQNKVVKSALDEKVDKETGKGLSTNDFTNAYKTKLGAIHANANHVEIEQVVTEGTTLANITIDGTTTAIKGSDIEVDEEISPTSTNPVENKAIYDALNNLLPSKTVSGNPISISDASGFNAKALTVSMNPIQDLHGYSNPWAGGAGKNKLPLTVSEIKSLNTVGEWNGNIYSRNNVTFELLVNSVNAVVGIKVNGTTSANTGFTLSRDTSIIQPSTSYNINGAPLGTASNTCRLQININDQTFVINVNGEDNSATTPSSIDKIDCYITVLSGRTANNLVFQPMIRLSTETDATFAPYENICPISGRTEASVTRIGKNLFDKSTVTTGKWLDDNGNLTNNSVCCVSDYIMVRPNTAYTRNIMISRQDITPTRLAFYDKDKTFIQLSASNIYTFTTPNNAFYIRSGILTADADACQIEIGSTATAYEPYTAETHTHQYSETIYGGVDDFVNGGLSNEWGYIASYAGETLPGEWLSDRDVYAPGTTPTTGAEVAYKLATPTTISTSAEEITLLKGNNVLSTNADDMELKYSVSLDSLLPTMTRTLAKSPIVEETKEETEEQR